MRRPLPLARLALGAALCLPALAFTPKSAHAFSMAESAMLLPLALLALGLTWRQRPLATVPLWAWGLGLALLGAFGLERLGAAQANLWPRLHLQDEAWPLWRWRVSLGLSAALLAQWAWDQRRHPSLGLLPALGLSLAAWACLAGALGPRPDISWRAVLEQRCYLMLFAAAWAQAGAEPALARRFAWMVLLAGVANTAYGLLQAFGLDPLPWNQGFGGRAGGFFGNPDLLGGHLALLLPLALALALDDAGSSLARAARWAVALMLALGLFATQTRGAWVGAGVGVALLLALVRGGHAALWQRQRLRLAWAAGGLLLLAALWAGTHPQVWQRWADTAQGSDPEAGRRAFLMTKTAQLALRHPLLGQGPGAFRIAFTSVEAQGIAPKDLATQPYVMSEHGHDDVLQWAADAGWPAALLWVALLAALASALWPRRASEAPGAGPGRDPLLVLGVLGSLTALQVHGLINYPYLMLPTQGVAWGLAGLALALSRRAEPQPAAAAAPPAPPAPRATRWPAWALLLAAAGALVWSGRRLAEDHLWWVAEGEQHLKNNDAASTLLVRTLAFDRREDRLWRLHGQSESDRGFIWNSIGSLREAVRLSPYDAEAAVRLGRACVENRLFDEAEAVLFKVAGYAPNFVDVWEPLAAAYYNQGKFKEAVEAYDWMLYFHVNDESAYANKAAAEGSLGKLPQALVTLNSAEQALPNSGKIKLNLAITYLKLGMRPQAQAAWKQASQLIPSDPQVDQLRKALH